jgi:hypothetical protein
MIHTGNTGDQIIMIDVTIDKYSSALNYLVCSVCLCICVFFVCFVCFVYVCVCVCGGGGVRLPQIDV